MGLMAGSPGLVVWLIVHRKPAVPPPPERGTHVSSLSIRDPHASASGCCPHVTTSTPLVPSEAPVIRCPEGLPVAESCGRARVPQTWDVFLLAGPQSPQAPAFSPVTARAWSFPQGQ